MSSASKTIATDVELFAAALSQRKVSVWTRTADDIYALLDEGGIIEKFTPDIVKINGEYYLRSECEFRVETDRE